MIRTYSEDYLPYVRNNLGTLFHFALAVDGKDIDAFSESFASSHISKMISIGEPRYLAGMSGGELYAEMFGDVPDENTTVFPGSEFWLGHTLAYLQWYWNIPFGELESIVPMREILSMYSTMHEADISKITEIIGRRLHPEPFIRTRRKMLGLTQSDLARVTGISLPAIRAYEQGSISVLDAESENIYRLSKVFGCSMEDILRNNVVFR